MQCHKSPQNNDHIIFKTHMYKSFIPDVVNYTSSLQEGAIMKINASIFDTVM